VECLAHLEAIRERPAELRSEAFDLGHLLLSLDVLACHLEHGRSERPMSEAGASTLVARAIELMDQDLTRRWTLDDLASQLFVSSFHLGRQFSHWAGLPPIAWLNRRRADRAAILLATTDTPAGTIGGQVGWPDPSYFSRRFRQHRGVSPRAYRARSQRHHARGTGRDRGGRSSPPEVSGTGG
jgi:AraC family L-rhamnose operon transcriptional activator RhaR